MRSFTEFISFSGIMYSGISGVFSSSLQSVKSVANTVVSKSIFYIIIFYLLVFTLYGFKLNSSASTEILYSILGFRFTMLFPVFSSMSLTFLPSWKHETTPVSVASSFILMINFHLSKRISMGLGDT